MLEVSETTTLVSRIEERLTGVGSACFEDQWAGVNATGKIVLIKRGNCTVNERVRLAKLHGALAVILYNQAPGTNYSNTQLNIDDSKIIVPLGLIPLEIGNAWKGRLAKGETLTVNLVVDSGVETRESWNVIAETKDGDPNNVVMLGAHLDSVEEGPGINDDGSGSSGLLEILRSFSKYSGFKNKVRFAWWGAEE